MHLKYFCFILQPLVIFKCFLWEGSFFMFFLIFTSVTKWNVVGLLQSLFCLAFVSSLFIKHLIYMTSIT